MAELKILTGADVDVITDLIMDINLAWRGTESKEWEPDPYREARLRLLCHIDDLLVAKSKDADPVERVIDGEITKETNILLKHGRQRLLVTRFYEPPRRPVAVFDDLAGFWEASDFKSAHALLDEAQCIIENEPRILPKNTNR